MAGDIEIAWKGVEKFEKALDEMVTRADHAVAKALVAAGQALKSSAAGRIHSHTGRLAGSIKPDGPHRVGFGTYEMKVGPTAVYARKVELGKHNPHGGGPHPYFRPGYEAAAMLFPRIFATAWRNA